MNEKLTLSKAQRFSVISDLLEGQVTYDLARPVQRVGLPAVCPWPY
jgi:hypothetical protein